MLLDKVDGQQSTPFSQYDIQNGHFRGREENVCSCSVQQQPLGAPFHTIKAANTNSEEKSESGADKDRPYTPCVFVLVHIPSLFISEHSSSMKEVVRATVERMR